VTFPPNVTTQTLTVSIRNDVLNEIDESFTVTLSNPNNASLGRAVATGTILDNDPVPTMTVGDAVIVEGDSGTTNLVFALQLSSPTGVPIIVQYATSNDTATAGIDYVAQNAAATFLPDLPAVIRNISVPVIGDVLAEPDETLFFHLLGVTNAILVRTQALGPSATTISSLFGAQSPRTSR